jgi:hypothetical protein
MGIRRYNMGGPGSGRKKGTGKSATSKKYKIPSTLESYKAMRRPGGLNADTEKKTRGEARHLAKWVVDNRRERINIGGLKAKYPK